MTRECGGFGSRLLVRGPGRGYHPAMSQDRGEPDPDMSQERKQSDTQTRGLRPSDLDATAQCAGALGERPGDHIGPYKLLQVIGEGGFGVVYLAERREPMVQRVALKIIKPGMDSGAVIARFEQERQALVVMDHPNVARVLDGSVTGSGRPYFVMELVKGKPITKFCDRHRLTIRQRLELFETACDAMQHAHMKGIIHRDLKPGNILVAPVDDRQTAEGGAVPGLLVKVIDFGVAKAISHALTDKTIFTEHGQIIGTPEYMSPEQAEMGATDVDTRHDVYSLGVILYELLCGALPFDAHRLRAMGYAEIQRVIREVDPPRPSTRLSTVDDAVGAAIARARQQDRERIAAELRRELEWIPLKALRKDRARRYAGAESLGADVRRYLAGEPLEAAPESRVYLLRKFARRNRGPLIAVGAVMLALVGGFGTAVSFWRQAEREKVRADERAETALVAQQQEAEQRRLADDERERADQKTAEADEQRKLAESKAAEAEAARLAEVEARETIEYNSYVANVQMAAAALDFRKFDRVRARLDACPERLRGWEWRWLNASADNSLAVLKRHASWVLSAAFSPDGTRIVTASGDNTARVWDAATGESLAELQGHTGTVSSASFSPDGTRIVTASGDGTALVWDSVPYRERFPAIERSRAARARMAPLVRERLAAGRNSKEILRELLGDLALTPEERTAVQALVHEAVAEAERPN